MHKKLFLSWAILSFAGALAHASRAESPEQTKGAARQGVKERKPRQPVQFYGRVVARAALQQRETLVEQEAAGEPGASTDLVLDEVTTLDLSVWQARVGVKAEGPRDWITAELEADVAGRFRMKDAYVQASGKGLRARIGQFKMPGPVLEMESSWKLPMVNRGLISEILSERLELGGRRPGVAFSARGRGGIKPRLTLGSFQGSNIDMLSRDTAPMSDVDVGSQSLVGRVELDFGSLELSAFYTYRVGTSQHVEAGDFPLHYPAGGADLVMTPEFAWGGLRFWLGGVLGASWYEHSENDPARAELRPPVPFSSGRVLAAVRWGGIRKGAFYAEPYVLCGVLDPDLDVVADMAWEASFGIQVGAWERARVGLEASVNDALRNFPAGRDETGYAIEHLLDRRSLILQAGVAF